MKYTSAEVKSGILVVLSVFLLLGLTFIVGRYMTGETHVFTLRFGYIAGLEEKAPVYFAGHEVGKVSQIRIEPEDARPVLVTVQLPKEITPRADSKAYIDTLGLMG